MQLLRLAVLAATFPVVFAQEISKPQIGNIAGVPSDKSFTGDCKASTQGYLEAQKGHLKLSEAEIGKFIQSNLHKGYIITIYPETKDGVFVDMECAATVGTNVPAHP